MRILVDMMPQSGEECLLRNIIQKREIIEPVAFMTRQFVYWIVDWNVNI